jgi:purine-binding chemotaxis protein CheW
MVVDSNGESIGIIVDAVTEVLRIPADTIEPPSNIIVTSSSDYMLGIAKRDGDMIVLLDLSKVLSKDQVSSPDFEKTGQQHAETHMTAAIGQ